MFPTISIPDRRLIIAVSILLVAGIFPGIVFGENRPGSTLSTQPPYQSPDNSATLPVSSQAPGSGAAEIPCLTGLCGSYVQALCVYNGDLYAGGAFWKADGKPVRNIARWDGSQWHDIGGANNEVQALIVYDGKLIAGGRFDSLGGVAASRVAAWDGTSWSPLGKGTLGPRWRFVGNFAVYNGKLVAGGEFDSAGTVPTSNIAAWDGATWTALNAGLPAQVTAVEIYNSELYAAGFFPARLAKWNGASWADVYAPASSYFYCLGVYDSRLIAAGYFPTMGNDTVNNIAAWDGVAWHALGSGFTLYGSGQNANIRTVFAYDGQLIAGGIFDIAGGDSIGWIAAWNGTSWNALGPELINERDYYVSVYGLTEYGGDLIVGGTFSGTDAIVANNIARWDGAAWHAITATDGLPFAVWAESRFVIEDDSVTVPIQKVAGSENAYGFDFLFDFDDTLLTFIEAVPGPLFDRPGTYEWEYFNYRGDPGSVRVVGLAETNDGGHHPLSTSIADGTELFSLTFQGTPLTLGDFVYTPLQFHWKDCGDNVIVIDSSEGTLAFSRSVFNSDLQDITDTIATFPTFGGAPQECLDMTGDSSRFIDYYDGAVFVFDSQQIDYRGDINLNGIANEIADWVMFINYFLQGLEAFDNHVEPSIAASDVNADGLALQMEDLVFLQRIICGDTLPVPAHKDFIPAAESVTVIQDVVTKTVGVAYDDTLAGMFIVVGGEITPTFLLDTARHLCSYVYDGTYTRIIILPMLGGPSEYCTEGFTQGPLFTYTGTGLAVQIDWFDDDILQAPQAADFKDSYFNRNHVQIDGVDGRVVPEEDSLPMSLARSAPLNSLTFYLGDFDGHAANDVDLSTLRFNGTIGYSGVDILPSYPGFAGPVIRLQTNARELITSYGSMDSLRSVYVTLGGKFTDQQTFYTLAKITLFPDTATLVVPSAWSSIRQATGVAIDGDTVLVEPGTYTGMLNSNFWVYSDFILRSTGGPDSTIIDCQWTWFIQAFDSVPGTVVIDGFTITNAYDPTNAAIDFTGKSLDIRNCVLKYNRGDGVGGAISVVDGALSVDGCVFTGNRAATGAAIAQGGSSDLTNLPTQITRSTFYGNAADSVTAGGIIHVYNSTVYPKLHKNIIAYNRSSQTVRSDGNVPSEITYNDIYGNSGGDWTGSLAVMLGQDCNMSENPLFCDTAAADFHLDGLSPCLAVNNECGQLMGAYGMGCGFVCGDINADLTINIADAVYVIAYIFRGGPPPENFIAADLNANGELDVADAVIIINYIFRGGPHPDCQSD